MIDRENIINQLDTDYREAKHRGWILVPVSRKVVNDALELLKEQQAEIKQLRNDANARCCKYCKHYDADENSELGTCVENGLCSTPDWFCADFDPSDEAVLEAFAEDG